MCLEGDVQGFVEHLGELEARQSHVFGYLVKRQGMLKVIVDIGKRGTKLLGHTVKRDVLLVEDAAAQIHKTREDIDNNVLSLGRGRIAVDLGVKKIEFRLDLVVKSLALAEEGRTGRFDKLGGNGVGKTVTVYVSYVKQTMVIFVVTKLMTVSGREGHKSALSHGEDFFVIESDVNISLNNIDKFKVVVAVHTDFRGAIGKIAIIVERAVRGGSDDGLILL
jgi:hypothetical protein